MLFQKKKKPRSIISIKIYSDSDTIYDGIFSELPFDQKLIVEKSIQFYDDPDPCYIHAGAVRIRLLGEIEEELLRKAGDNQAFRVPGTETAALCMYFPRAADCTVSITLS